METRKGLHDTKKELQDTRRDMQNQAASLRNIEVQMGQLANLLFNRLQRSLPSNTKVNPKEQIQAINMRNENKFYERRQKPSVEEPSRAIN